MLEKILINASKSFTMDPPSSKREVKLSYDSFIENRDVLSWNILISAKISKTEGNLIKCNECEFSGESQSVLVGHVEMRHLDNFPGYTCILCRVVLQTWIIFKRHVNSVHCSTPELLRSSLQSLPVKGASLRNGINGYSYDKTPKISFAALQSESVLKCTICDFQTSEVNTLTIHNQYIHGIHESQKTRTTRRHDMGLGFKCLKCEKQFTFREELYKHSVQDHQYNPPGQDNLTNGGFSISEVSFEVPIYEPPKERQRIGNFGELKKMRGLRGRPSGKSHCTFCIKSFHKNEECIEHEFLHNGHFTFSCHLCQEGFRRTGFRQRVRFLDHMDKFHKVTKDPNSLIPCKRCYSRVFFDDEQLQQHNFLDHKDSVRASPLDFVKSATPTERNSPMKNVQDDKIEKDPLDIGDVKDEEGNFAVNVENSDQDLTLQETSLLLS